MKFDQVPLYPTTVHCGVADDLSDSDFVYIQDAIENRLRNKEQLKEIHCDPGYTDEAFFGITQGAFPKIKQLFEETALAMHEELYPGLKGKFKILDSMCRGVVYNQNTHDTPHCNVPWHYSGIFIAKSPKNLNYPEGAITFLDPRPYSAEINLYQLESKRGVFVIYPSWQRFEVNAIKSVNDTLMMLHMHIMFLHDTEIKNSKFEYIGPGYKHPDLKEVDVLPLSDDEDGEVDIGRA
jgi:hypothetical protein